MNKNNKKRQISEYERKLKWMTGAELEAEWKQLEKIKIRWRKKYVSI